MGRLSRRSQTAAWIPASSLVSTRKTANWRVTSNSIAETAATTRPRARATARLPSAWGMATSTICLVAMGTSAPRMPPAAPMIRTRNRSLRKPRMLYLSKSQAPSVLSGKGA